MLCAFALSQPLLDILGRNPTFFAVRDSTATEIVLFALALVLVPPAALLGLEVGVGFLSAAAGRVLHLVFVGALLALIALHVLTKADLLSGLAALVVAIALGASAAVLYSHAGAIRSVLSVLAPVPLVFVALFLFASQSSDLIFASTPVVQAADFEARTSVVLVVFDELSTLGLMGRNEKIDAQRFPNFASLGRDATWFRNATTEYGMTEGAVPSILTGRVPQPTRAPVYAQYPQNIFTLLGKRYRMRVVESLTNLCPRTLCHTTTGKRAYVAQGKAASLVSDAGIVYLHLVVPEPYVDRVPAIDQSWGNFGETREQTVRRGTQVLPCNRNVCAFTKLIDGSRQPTLYLLHTLLPHVPYEYLPSGRRYAIDAPDLRGQRNGLWADRGGMLDSYRRYLLQLGYVDRALGLILRKLRATGTYDRSLVIVTADHGVSFRSGEPRRLPTRRNLDDIAFVPLFVKLPGQQQPRVVDAGVHTIDVLPTIVRVLGIKPPWRLDGRPLVGRGGADSDRVSLIVRPGTYVSAPLAQLRARRARAARDKIAAFGAGSFSNLYRVGPAPQLAGRRLADLAQRGGGGRVELDGSAFYDAVDPASGFVPAYVSGRVSGLGPGTHDLAIGVNGRVAATTTTYDEGGERFAVLIPEQALRAGRNTVDVSVLQRTGTGLRLRALSGGTGGGTVLRDRGGTLTLERPGQASVPVTPGALQGTVAVARKGASWVFSGWAADLDRKRPAESLLLLADGREVFRTAAHTVRPQRVLGQKVPREAYSFEFTLPASLLPERGAAHTVRLFALRGRVASEPRYGASYPWSRTG